MKTTKEMIEVMQAYERGEQIEFCYNDENIKVWENTGGEPLWNWGDTDYRVKQKNKGFLPFKTAEEFLDAQRVHGNVVVGNGRNHAYINAYGRVVIVLNENIYAYLTLDDLFYYKYNFLDGTPCGKEVQL